MAENPRDLWHCLALDGIGDLLVEARPGFVVAADARRVLFANVAGRRFLGLGARAPLDAEGVLDSRLAERLTRFAERAGAGAATRELLRVRDGLKTSLLSLSFRRAAADGPIAVLVETTAPDAADGRAEANLALLVAPGGMVALFDGHGDVVAAQGDHGAVEGLDDELERILDAAETLPVVERDVPAPGGTRPVALVSLGSTADARRLLWVGALQSTAKAEPVAEPTPIAATPTEPVAPAEPAAAVEEVEEEPRVAPAAPMPATLCDDTVVEDVFTEGFDEAPFIAAAPLALDAWDEDDAGDAAWIAHATAPEVTTPTEAVIAKAEPAAPAPEIAAPVEATEAPAPVEAAPVEPTSVEPLALAAAPAEAPLVPTEATTAVEPVAAEATPAADDGDGFRFDPPGRAVKFVWLMDAERRFTLLSPELAEVVGPAVTRLVGRSWSEIAGELGFDGDGVIAEALARRDTWSGRTVLWPVEGEALRVPVDLAALPAFDRGRVFAGFRGFGTCRADEPVPDPTAVGLRLRAPAPAAAPLAALPAPAEEHVAEPAAEPAVYPDDTEVALLADHADAEIDEATEAAFVGEIVAAEASDTPEPPALPLVPADVAEAVEALTPPAPATPVPTAEIPVEPVAVAVVETPAPVAETSALEAAPEPKPAPRGRTVADTAAIAAAVAAFTAAGAPKTGPARADAPLTPTTPVPTPARDESADRVVALGRAKPEATPENPRLSQPERVAFHQIAEALGVRVEGQPAPAPAAAVEAASAKTPVAEPPAVETAAPETVAPAAVADVVEPTATPAPAPADAPAPAAKTAETARPVDPRMLDRLPLAVAVIKDDTVVYANERFLDLLRYPDLATLEAAGGLDGLFAGEHVARRWEGGEAGRPMPLIARDGTLVPAETNITTIPWVDGSALMMTLNEVAPVPARVVPEPAKTDVAPEPAKPEIAAEPPAVAAVVETPLSAIETPSNVVPLTPAIASVTAAAPSSEAERISELEAIVDTATDGVLMLDAEGIVLSANTAAEALFGTERRAMIGRPLTERLAPESRRSAMDYLDGLARNGVASVLNDGREVIGAVRPEGLIPLFMTIGNISSGPVKKYCAVLRDITQWKKAEEDLTTARRRAEEASIHKSDFLAKISHEIRTPLNAIIGFSELMMDERFGPVGNDRYKDYLRDIHVSGTHIMSLVNDLLDLSKVEAGKMDLRFEAVTLADVVSECVAMMQPQANRERIIIRSSLPVGVPPVVADPRSMRQVVLNLLSNAIKFTPAGGQVIVSTTLEDNGEVVMRVRDTGYGMTDKEMQTAMEPFRQLHTTRSRGGGTGLGLPLTKALVEANRAVFRIDSTVGQGTLVSIAFPVTRVLAS